MAARTMFDGFQDKGRWWLPGNDGHKVPGTLHYKAGEAILLGLDGTFAGATTTPPFMRHEPNLPIVHGHLNDGTPCTALHGRYTSGNWNSHGHATATYQVLHLFEGKHFNAVEDVAFDSLSFNSTYLEQWCKTPTLGFPNPDGEYEMLVGHKRPEAIIIPVPNFDFEFRAESLLSEHNDWRSLSVSLSVTAALTLKPKEPKRFGWY